MTSQPPPAPFPGMSTKDGQPWTPSSRLPPPPPAPPPPVRQPATALPTAYEAGIQAAHLWFKTVETNAPGRSAFDQAVEYVAVANEIARVVPNTPATAHLIEKCLQRARETSRKLRGAPEAAEAFFRTSRVPGLAGQPARIVQEPSKRTEGYNRSNGPQKGPQERSVAFFE